MTTNKIFTQNKKFYGKNVVFGFFSVVIATIIIVILCNPARYNAAVLEGLHLFLICVLPGLFPFMFLTKLLTSLGMVKKLSGFFEKPTQFLFNTTGIASYVFIISALSGYPVGAKIISDLYKNGNITQADAKKMAAFCTTSGPLFVIGTVGTIMFGNATIGIILFISHILSSVMCGIIFRGKRQKCHKKSDISPSQSLDNLLANTMMDTIENILLVGGYITIFFLLSDLLVATGVFSFLSIPINTIFHSPSLANGLLHGIVEITQGCKLLSANIDTLSIAIAGALISFGGISIFLQSMAYLSRCKIKARYFLFVKCVHSILTFILCFALCRIFIF